MHANHREELPEVRAGDIAAAVGHQVGCHRRDPLRPCGPAITLERMEFPDPVISVAVEPKTKADQDRMGTALGKLAARRIHPSGSRATRNRARPIISGMGELHLEVMVDRLRREFGVDANVGRPQVAYRETIRKSIEQESRFVRQTGGRGQYGHVFLRIEPTESGTGFEFVRQDHGRGHSKRIHTGGPPKGVEEQMKNGILAGFPVVDVRVTLYDGSYPRGRLERGRLPGRRLPRVPGRSPPKARPVVLEPMMKVDVVTPDEHLGRCHGRRQPAARNGCRAWRNRRAGRSSAPKFPFPRCSDTRPTIRSLTQGRATFNMEFRALSRSAVRGGGSHHSARKPLVVPEGEGRSWPRRSSNVRSRT